MNKLTFVCAVFTLFASATASMAQQPAAKTEEKKPLPLVYTQALPLPGVQGRFDHFSADPERARIYLSALGNDTLEVIDTVRGARIQSVTGLGMPQGIVYVPDFQKLFVGNRVAGPHDPDVPGKGVVKVFDASGGDLKLIDTIEFHNDCDNLRYDAADKRVYVGFGDGPTAGIGMIDAATDKRVGEYILGAHPESFQIEKSGTKIFVNIADDNLVAVVDRKTGTVTKWPLKGLANNFPMALDEEHHRLFIGVPRPATPGCPGYEHRQRGGQPARCTQHGRLVLRRQPEASLCPWGGSYQRFSARRCGPLPSAPERANYSRCAHRRLFHRRGKEIKRRRYPRPCCPGPRREDSRSVVLFNCGVT